MTQTASLSVLLDNNSVSGNVLISKVENASEVQKAALSLRGTLNRADNSFSGTITDTAFGLSGSFKGALFGPAGENLGLVFRVTDATGDIIYVGDFAGQR